MKKAVYVLLRLSDKIYYQIDSFYNEIIAT